MAEETKPIRKKIMATSQMNQYMADYFHQLDQASASGEKKIAWCNSVGPAELLLAMGFLVYYAGFIPHGCGHDPVRQCSGLFTGYLFLPDFRYRGVCQG